MTCKFEIWDTGGAGAVSIARAVVLSRGDGGVDRVRCDVGGKLRARAVLGRGAESTRGRGVSDAVGREQVGFGGLQRVENVVESAEALAAEYGMVGYVETSAKENVGVREAFELVARAVVFREEEDA